MPYLHFADIIFLAELNCVTETTTKLHISAAILFLHVSARNTLTRHFLKTHSLTAHQCSYLISKSQGSSSVHLGKMTC